MMCPKCGEELEIEMDEVMGQTVVCLNCGYREDKWFKRTT